MEHPCSLRPVKATSIKQPHALKKQMANIGSLHFKKKEKRTILLHVVLLLSSIVVDVGTLILITKPSLHLQNIPDFFSSTANEMILVHTYT